MATKNFYKDSTTGVFFIGNDVLPTGKYRMNFYKNDTVVSLIDILNNEAPIMDGIEITNLLKEGGTPYTDREDLLLGVKDFFSDAIGDGGILEGSVDTYLDLPAASVSNDGSIYYVKTSSGGSWIKTVFSFYEYPKGFYISDGVNWTKSEIQVKVSEDATSIVNINDWSAYISTTPEFNTEDRIVFKDHFYVNLTGTYSVNTPLDDITNWRHDHPSNTIYLAESGGDFSDVKQAIESVVGSNGANRFTIQVYPGVYTVDNSLGEIELPSFTSIDSVGDRTVIFQPSNPALPMFSVSGTTTFMYLKGIVFSGNTGSTSWILSHTGSGNVNIWDCVLRDCSVGFLQNGVGGLEIKKLAVNTPSAITTQNAVKIQSGKFSIDDIILRPTATVTTGIDVSGAGSIGTISNISSIGSGIVTPIKLYDGCYVLGFSGSIVSATDGVVVYGDNTKVRLFSFLIDSCNNDGFRIENTGTNIDFTLSSGVVTNCSNFNFNVLNPNCTVTGDGFTELAKGNIVDGAQFYTSLTDITEGDEGVNIFGELHVGRPMKPAESVFGGGDSHIFEYVYTFDGVSTYTDKTDIANSFSGSTFQFDGITTDNSIYIANRYPITFEGIKTTIETAAVIGGGEIITEYWNGAWVEFNACTVLSGTPFLKFAKNYFDQTESYHIKYNPYITNDWIVSDPVSLGSDYYWMRFRIKSTITTSPVIQQIKIHTSRTEINGDGTSEFHMDARVYKKLTVDAVKPIEGNMQSASVYVDENIGVGLDNNRFTSINDMLGVSFELPEDCDTSAPLILVWKGKFAATGSAQFTIRLKIVKPGDSYSNSEPVASGEVITTLTELRTISAIDIREDFRVDLDISKAIPSRNNDFGDEIWITIQNTTRSGNFDYTKISANYLSDFAGRHIRQ